jgi:hypothetical protein
MIRAPVKPTKAQISRAVKAVQAAGIEVGAVEIDSDTGGIKVIAKGVRTSDNRASTKDDFDNWIAKRHARSTQRH